MDSPEWYVSKELIKVLSEISESLKVLAENTMPKEEGSCKPTRFDRSLTKKGRE